VGPNGIGKTTLLRILAGLDAPSGGQVHRARGLRLGYLPQESVLESNLTLWEECLEVFAELRALETELAELESRMADPALAGEALERYGNRQAEFEHRGGYTYPTLIRQVLGGLGFDVSDYAMPLMHLSGGQRTRAVLARLLLSQPDLLVLDEPTNGLDPLMQHEFLRLIRERREAGVAVFLSSHILSEVQSVADRLAVLRAGQILVQGTVAEVRGHARQRVEVWFETDAPAGLASLPGIEQAEVEGRRFGAVLAGSVRPLLAALAGLPVESVRIEEPDLEDAFIGLWEDAR
jgi:ATP-binding cassette subfamily F protein 3